MKVGVPKETAQGERRVALVPELVSKLDGIDVVVEQGAGAAASFTDDAFTEAGAAIGDPWAADLVAKVRKPSDDEVGKLRDGQVLIGFLQPLTDQEGIERLAARGVTAFAMESIPRITRAQSMDALSSQATVSGYKAVAPRRGPAAEVPADAGDRGGNRRAGQGARASERVWPDCRRSQPRGASARSSPASTSGPRSRNRSRASVRSSSSWASSARRPRGATRASCRRRSSATSRRSSRRASATSTSSSRPRSSPAGRRRS